MRMTMNLKVAGVIAALSLLAAAPSAAQVASRGGTDPAGEQLTYPIEFDTVEAYLMSLVPPSGRANVRDLALSSENQSLRVDADVNLGGLPGFEFFGAFGFTHLTAAGPVTVVRPGVVAWEIKAMRVAGQPVAEAMWGPVLRRATKREDSLVPFRVGQWVKQVQVDSTRLVLH